MCPLWESIKFDDNSPDFALSYHRGLYHRRYDDPDDIYLQRWRVEDKTWNHTCCYPDGQCDDRLYQERQDVTLPAMDDRSPPDHMAREIPILHQKSLFKETSELTS